MIDVCVGREIHSDCHLQRSFPFSSCQGIYPHPTRCYRQRNNGMSLCLIVSFNADERSRSSGVAVSHSQQRHSSHTTSNPSKPPPTSKVPQRPPTLPPPRARKLYTQRTSTTRGPHLFSTTNSTMLSEAVLHAFRVSLRAKGRRALLQLRSTRTMRYSPHH